MVHVRAPEGGKKPVIHTQHIILTGHRQALSWRRAMAQGIPLTFDSARLDK
jgi:hypothetical protein